MACFIEISLNESLSSQDQTFESEPHILRPRLRLSEVSLSFETETGKLLMVETKNGL